MEVRKDILTVEDVRNLVDTFYAKVREDDTLGPIFNERIQNHWPQHLEKLTRFWQTVLLEDHTYFGSPFPPHADLPVDHTHFARWLSIFSETIDELFEGEKAKEAKWRAGKMAEMFQYKIDYYRKQKGKNLI
jgi:hemoglobin